jgi:O-antigen/teichoic acid export membrane protein
MPNTDKTWSDFLVLPGFRKYFANTSWLMAERIFRSVLLLVVGVYVARYLGPEQFGLLSYAMSFVALFSAIGMLGLDGIVVRELVKDGTKRDELLGTAYFLKLMGAILVLAVLYVAAFFTLSKYVVYAQFISLIASSLIKLFLIWARAPLLYFAIVFLLDGMILATGLVIAYIRQKLNVFDWKFSPELALRLLKCSWPLVLSGVCVSIYMKIDQVMIKEILDTKAVGNYAVAVRLSEAWYFVPIAITGSLFPAIIKAKKISTQLYHDRLQMLYDLIVWLAIAIAIPITFFAGDIVNILFGVGYSKAGTALSIHIWAGIFVFLGVASSKWLLTEDLQKFCFYRTFIGAIVNIALNLLLIPRYELAGAATATILSYMVAVFGVMVTSKTRIGFRMLLKSFILPARVVMLLFRDRL